MTSAFLLTTWSMKPGSWWLKPLWSCRQTCERQQVVERGDRPPPGDVVAHLQPLGVLVEHRVDDVDERLVAGEEAVPAGQQIALQPALALVLAEHLHDAAVRARGGRRRGRVSAIQARLVTSSTSCQRFELFSSGLKRRKFVLSRFSFMTSRRNLPMTRVDSAVVAPGAGHVDGVVAEVGQLAGRAAAGRRWRAGWRSCGARPCGASSASSGMQPAVRRRTAPPAGSSSSTSRGCWTCSGLSMSPIGTWCDAPVALGTSCRRSPSGRSSPWACGGRSSASAGRFGEAVAAGVGLDALDLADDRVERRRPAAGASSAGSSPSTK